MGKLLKQKKVLPDLILTSPATRAISTAQAIANELNISNIVEKEEIYEASFSKLITLIEKIENSYDTVFLVGHNPSLNMLANELCSFAENIVTCGIVEIKLDISSWSDISYENSKFISFEFPKKYIGL